MTMPSSRALHQKPIIELIATSSVPSPPAIYTPDMSSYKYPVHIRFQPNVLTDHDKEVVAEYCKTHFSNCLVANETVPICQTSFLHCGGLCTKKPATVARELHAKLGFEKDPAVMTYHNNQLVRTSDESRSLVNVKKDSEEKPSLVVSLFTVDLFEHAANGYWANCPSANEVYKYKELTVDMMAPISPSFNAPNGGAGKKAAADSEKNFINDWYAAMVASEGCHHPTTISVPEHLVYNYNILLSEGRLKPITSQPKLQLMLAQFYQAVCQKSVACLHSIGLEFIPSTKDVKELRQSLLKRKRDEIETIANKQALSQQRIFLPNFTDGVTGYDIAENRFLASRVYTAHYQMTEGFKRREFFGPVPFDSQLTTEQFQLERLSEKYGV